MALQGDIQARKYWELVCMEPLNPRTFQNLQEQDHSSLSLDNLLTQCNNIKHSLCLKGSDATVIFTLLRVKNTNTVSRDNQLIYVKNAFLFSFNNSKKVNGLDCYFQRYIMRDRRCENSKHASRATDYFSLLFWLLHIFTFQSVLQSLFEFFASIHLLVFGCLFLVGQRLRGWVLSKRLANKSAWSSLSEVPLHVFSNIINFRVFWVKIHFGVRQSRRH